MIERILQFGPGGRNVGILSDPRGGATTGMLLLNAGILHRVGNCRLSVRVARRLAEAGFPSYRFDFSGMGDSERRDDGLTGLAASHDEVREAIRLFRETTGTDRVVLFGLCRGADVAVRAAADLPEVAGLALIDPYVYATPRFYVERFAPRMLVPEVWLRAPRTLARMMTSASDEAGAAPIRPFPPKDEVAALLQPVVARGGRFVAWFTGGYTEEYAYEGQFRDCFGDVPFGANLRERFLREADHIISEPEGQRAVVDDALALMQEVAGGPVAPRVTARAG